MAVVMKIQSAFQKAGKTIDWFVPPHIQTQHVLHRRARLLMWIHVFILVLCLLMLPSSFFIEDASYFPIVFTILSLTISMFLFRRWGSISLSSNIFTAIPALALIPLIFSSGGMYSDNLLWLYLCPLIAFLLTGKSSRIFWALAVVGFHGYLFILESLSATSYSEDIAEGAAYYFTSYLFLSLMTLGIVYIFKLEQDFIIKQLRQHKNTLTRQKEAIEQQANQLREQEQELQLFQNLISNSLKFQKADVPPDIHIIHAGINGHHHIKVSDNGMGIPIEHLHNVFEFGDQGEKEKSHCGQGIGLATCKKIVHRFGGDISVASEVNQGTEFTIKLPIA